MKKYIVYAVFFVMASVSAVWAADIALQPVDSSLVGEAGYDAQTQTLAIRLVNNSTLYLYQQVPANVYAEFLASDSKGTYFVTNIKYQYDAEKEP